MSDQTTSTTTTTTTSTATAPLPTDPKSQSRFVADFGELENHLRKINAEIGNTPMKRTQSFTQLADGLVKAHVLDPDWLKSPAVKETNELRNKVVHGQTSGDELSSEIRKATSTLSRLWSDVNEQYTFYLARKYFSHGTIGLTTEGGFDLLGEVLEARLAIEIKTFRSRKVDTRLFAEAMDKYYNFISVNQKRLIYGLFLFQSGTKNTGETLQYFREQLGRSTSQNIEDLHLVLIDLNAKEGLAQQIQEGLTQLLPLPVA